tara:strand:- start:607 stop:813 length:207 start_codon:yes stop_codon:yes gene_type:complete
MSYHYMKLLAEQSIVDGKQKLTENDIRDMVGAPTIEEELEAQARAERNECICGTINCETEYSCYTMGY